MKKARKPLARGLFGKLFAGKRDQKKVKSIHDGSLDAGGRGGDAQQLVALNALKDGERKDCRFDAAGRAGDSSDDRRGGGFIDVLESGEVILSALATTSPSPVCVNHCTRPRLWVLRR